MSLLWSGPIKFYSIAGERKKLKTTNHKPLAEQPSLNEPQLKGL